MLLEKCDSNQDLRHSLYTLYQQTTLMALKSAIGESYGDLIKSDVTTQTIDVKILGEGRAEVTVDFRLTADRQTYMHVSQATVNAGSEMRAKAHIEIDGGTITMRDMTYDVVLTNGLVPTPRPAEVVDAAW
jgi:hypothetical protein